MLIYVTSSASAQTVSTVVSGFSVDALAVDAAGNIYASDFFGTSSDPNNPNGTKVRKISPDGSTVSVVDSSFFAPTGLAFDATGNLFVAGTDGKISKVTFGTSGSTTTTFASSLSDLGGLAFDKSGNLYAAQYSGNKIYKITSGGTVSTLVASGLNGPVALTFANDTLYAANFNDGNIYKVSATGALTFVADVMTLAQFALPVGYMVFSGGNLLVNVGSYTSSTTSVGNRIYKVTLNGQTSVFSGTGVSGETNGAVATATYAGNNGMALSPTGDTLYISEANGKRIRRITGLNASSAAPKNGAKNPQGFLLEQNYPNPFNPSTVISYQLLIAGQVSLKVFDMLGREVATLVDAKQAVGNHSVNFNAANLTSGVYLYTLNAGSFSDTKKMLLVK
ncbi:MAG: SMP-30/gluconolactonase/LRE family protein [Rhizobacter sp.]|nr:SMP-30/gluconolactonase/LRE family protein [Chlorobiales bacterium]